MILRAYFNSGVVFREETCFNIQVSVDLSQMVFFSHASLTKEERKTMKKQNTLLYPIKLS